MAMTLHLQKYRLSAAWRTVGLLVAVFMALVLGGCASMSKSDCRTADAEEWTQVGYRDGARGLQQDDRLTVHARACGKHGFDINTAAYRKGHHAGLIDYCVPQRGYQIGSRVENYAYNCPSDVEAEFLQAYQTGLQHALTMLRFYEWDLDSDLWSAERGYRRENAASAEGEATAESSQRLSRSLERVNSIESRIRDVQHKERDILRSINRAERRLGSLSGSS